MNRFSVIIRKWSGDEIPVGMTQLNIDSTTVGLAGFSIDIWNKDSVVPFLPCKEEEIREIIIRVNL